MRQDEQLDRAEASETKAQSDGGPAAGPVFEVLRPARQALPLVLASPHSGTEYPPDFVARSRLDMWAIRRSEDTFVDRIFGLAPSLGAPLIRALFPRAFVDANREPFELDPLMFAEPLPSFANIDSPRVAAGLGTIARVVGNGAEIYRDKLSFAEAQARIDRYYRPYHDALQGLIADTVAQFGTCLLLDCHSMPSVGGPMESDAGRRRVDFVLGDCFGTSCAPAITGLAEACLAARDYRVVRNDPYAGGFTTRHYGRPGNAVHALQIEINRGLYMREDAYEAKDYLPQLTEHMGELIGRMGAALPLSA